MGLAGGDSKRNIEAIAIYALLLSFASFSFVNLVTRPVACFPGDIGTIKCPLQPGTHDLTSLGTWNNIPPSSSCGIGNTSAPVCELMGNMSYRGILKTQSSIGATGVSVGLTVGCITPSNTAGAILNLQYANYSDTTHTNTTNFVGIGNGVFIDNSANWPCPGNLEATTGPLPFVNANPAIFIFRVVESGGGGTGDNPRFSSVSVYVIQSAERTYYVDVGSRTTTNFKYIAYATFPSSLATVTVNIGWIATNTTVAGCTVVTSACVQHGQTSTTIATGAFASPQVTVTFGTAFGGTPDVVTQVENVGNPISIPIGSISLLQAQTLTV